MLKHGGIRSCWTTEPNHSPLTKILFMKSTLIFLATLLLASQAPLHAADAILSPPSPNRYLGAYNGKPLQPSKK